MKNRKVLFIATIIIVLAASSFTVKAQYLRDKTRFIGLNKFYPKEDSMIFENYRASEKYQISLHKIFSIPEIKVRFNEKEFPFVFDFGNSGNIAITNNIIDSIKYSITDTTYTYTPNGEIRGEVYQVTIPEFQVFDKSFNNEQGTLLDWSILSSEPLNGLIGLKYLAHSCFTLSYRLKTLAISNRSILPDLSLDSSIIIPLEHYKMHPYGLHFEGKVNDQKAIIYLDSGKNKTAINRNLVPSEKIVSDKSGNFYDGTVEVALGADSFRIYFPRVRNISRNIETELPVGIEIGSDVLKYMLLSVDRSKEKDLLIIHR